MIAVLGSGGQLGSAFLRLLGDGAMAVDRSALDLADLEAIPRWVDSARPDLVINCAAYTAVDAAETDQQAARTVNAIAVGALAKATARLGIGLVTFSTDYVFDGEKREPYVESDTPNPLNVYGETKLEGERLALEAHPEALVVRTSWLMSTTHRCFLTTMLELIPQGEVRVVDDQRGSPTFVDDLARATVGAIEARVTGLLHLANQGSVTWFQLAREIAELSGLDAAVIIPIPSSALKRPARRPAYSVLRSRSLESLGMEPLSHYGVSLRRSLVTP